MLIRTKKNILLGAHMSINGGPYKAIERGESIGCTAIQIFTKSNRQWKTKELTKDELILWLEKKKNSFVKAINVHASYLINLGSPNKDIEKKSIEALKIELSRCDQLQIPYLVLHPGSHVNNNEEQCLKQITKNINTIFKNKQYKTILLLENMAGQGSTVGYTFEQLAYILKNSETKNIGICFDTCHAFAAGYLFSTKKDYKKMWEHFDQTIGIKNLKIIHVNDSQKPCGSHVDRHEHISKGMIGIEAFRLLMNDARFKNVPKILETPHETINEDANNMEILLKLINEK
jgi:deoxyribonuclease-4